MLVLLQIYISFSKHKTPPLLSHPHCSAFLCHERNSTALSFLSSPQKRHNNQNPVHERNDMALSFLSPPRKDTQGRRKDAERQKMSPKAGKGVLLYFSLNNMTEEFLLKYINSQRKAGMDYTIMQTRRKDTTSKIQHPGRNRGEAWSGPPEGEYPILSLQIYNSFSEHKTVPHPCPIRV